MSHVAEIRLTINTDCARKLLMCMCVYVFNREILRVKISLSFARTLWIVNAMKIILRVPLIRHNDAHSVSFICCYAFKRKRRTVDSSRTFPTQYFSRNLKSLAISFCLNPEIQILLKTRRSR